MAKQKTKAELQAELDQKEQELEAANAAKAKAEEQAQNSQQQSGAATVVAPAKQADPKIDPTIRADDTRTHFCSKFKRYRVAGCQFENNRFATDDEAQIKKLKDAQACGIEFWIVERAA